MKLLENRREGQEDKDLPKNETKQIVSKQRVADHGEVFTAEREVKAMCDLVKSETERIDSRFLEPACGTGNFLAEILARKLAIVDKETKIRGRRSCYDWERKSLLALGSLYGVELLMENVHRCQDRLFQLWWKDYKRCCRKECNIETRNSAEFILRHNIVCGNALTLKCVDAAGQDTKEDILFSEWSFPRNDAIMYRKDYSFAELLKDENTLNLGDAGEGVLKQSYSAHYRQLSESDVVWQAALKERYQEELF